MQSDGNSFWGDVVLESFNKAYRDEYNIFDQMIKSKYVLIHIMKLYEFLVLFL